MNERDEIAEFIAETQDLGDALAETAGATIDSGISDFTELVEVVSSVITEEIQANLDSLEATTATASADVITEFNQVLAENNLVLDEAEERLLIPLRQGSTLGVEALDDLIRRVKESIEATTGDATLTEEIFTSIIRGELENVIERTDKGLEGFAERITSELRAHVIQVETETESIIERVTNAVPGLLSGIGSTLTSIPEAVAGLAGSISSGLVGGLTELLDFAIGSGFALGAEQIDEFVKEMEQDPDIGSLVKQFTGGGAIQFTLPGLVFLVFIAQGLAMATAQSVFAGPLERARQGSLARTRPSIFALNEILTLRNRDEIDDEKSFETLRRAGFTEEDIGHLMELRFVTLTAADVLALWRRNEIGTDELERRLLHQGYDHLEQTHLRTLAFPVPPVNDQITFAVREVFDVELSQALGQLEGLPEELRKAYFDAFGKFGEGIEGSLIAFAEYAKQAGLAPEWASAYWASHWQLPGLRDLFEMAHRLDPRIIDAEPERFTDVGLDPEAVRFDLDSLERAIRAKDFAPFWRDRLRAIAFTPLSRVDIRRMHRIGVLDRDQVWRAYKRIGYDDFDAENLTVFTEILNAPPQEKERDETKDLTRNVILNLYEKGIIEDAVEVHTDLVEIGYSEADAEALIQLRNIKIDESIQTDQLRLIEARFKKGLLDYNEAVTALDALAVTPIQRSRFLITLETRKELDARMPTQINMDKFLGAELITLKEYKKGLFDIGFREPWITRFAALIVSKPEDENGAETSVDEDESEESN